jgi:hypothetical protein
LRRTRIAAAIFSIAAAIDLNTVISSPTGGRPAAERRQIGDDLADADRVAREPEGDKAPPLVSTMQARLIASLSAVAQRITSAVSIVWRKSLTAGAGKPQPTSTVAARSGLVPDRDLFASLSPAWARKERRERAGPTIKRLFASRRARR